MKGKNKKKSKLKKRNVKDFESQENSIDKKYQSTTDINLGHEDSETYMYDIPLPDMNQQSYECDKKISFNQSKFLFQKNDAESTTSTALTSTPTLLPQPTAFLESTTSLQSTSSPQSTALPQSTEIQESTTSQATAFQESTLSLQSTSPRPSQALLPKPYITTFMEQNEKEAMSRNDKNGKEKEMINDEIGKEKEVTTDLLVVRDVVANKKKIGVRKIFKESVFRRLLSCFSEVENILKDCENNNLSVKEFMELIEEGTQPNYKFTLEERSVLLEMNDINVNKVLDQLKKEEMELEIVEYQIRSSLLSKSERKNGKLDIPFTLKTMLSNGRHSYTMENFKNFLDEKLGIKIASWISSLVFVRLFQSAEEVSPKVFLEKLEKFTRRSCFTSSTFEGMLRKLLCSHQNLADDFQKLDQDNSKTISIQEFASFLKEKGMTLPEEVLLSFVEKFDKDGDKQLNYQEFLDFATVSMSFRLNIIFPYGRFNVSIQPNETIRALRRRIFQQIFWKQHRLSVKTSLPLLGQDFCIKQHYGFIPSCGKDDELVGKHFVNGELLFITASKDAPFQFQEKVSTSIPRPPRFNFFPSASTEKYSDNDDAKSSNGHSSEIAFSTSSSATTINSRKKRGTALRIPPSSLMDKKLENRKKLMDEELPVSVSMWDVNHVMYWMSHLAGLPQYRSQFSTINGKELLELDNMTLRDQMGIASSLHRKKILMFIAEHQSVMHSSKYKNCSPNTQVEKLSIKHIGHWLTHVVHLPEYQQLFLSKNIKGKQLDQLTDSDLLKIGITSKNHRQRILQALNHSQLSTNQRLSLPSPDANIIDIQNQSTDESNITNLQGQIKQKKKEFEEHVITINSTSSKGLLSNNIDKKTPFYRSKNRNQHLSLEDSVNQKNHTTSTLPSLVTRIPNVQSIDTTLDVAKDTHEENEDNLDTTLDVAKDTQEDNEDTTSTIEKDTHEDNKDDLDTTSEVETLKTDLQEQDEYDTYDTYGDECLPPSFDTLFTPTKQDNPCMKSDNILKETFEYMSIISNNNSCDMKDSANILLFGLESEDNTPLPSYEESQQVLPS